ncbi:hypothetical protein C5167_036849 [Papaver somniferum]|uniref:5-formyltetrahydrofolate cyclo-ligase n=1 Tax=Papaver somniferum TaxID=3469 RepID=A0A4Y7I8U7_PAPSO|nr:hypothetical protein C5167_036849 [Papaver somniferum]
MAEKAQIDISSSNAAEEGEEDPKAWKWIIRKRVWDMMEAEIKIHVLFVIEFLISLVLQLLPKRKLSELEVFKKHQTVLKLIQIPHKHSQVSVVLCLIDECEKKLLTRQPQLRTGFFSVLESSMLSLSTMGEACTSVGVAKYGMPIGLDEKLKVDLIVIRSVAVDQKTGARLGKGEGFAELEYAMLRYMGAIDDNTPVVTTIHDRQLVDDIPVEKLVIHDVPVDFICTPTQVIFTNNSIPKPQEKLGQIRILRELKRRIERETRQKLPSGPSEKLPATAQRKRR